MIRDIFWMSVQCSLIYLIYPKGWWLPLPLWLLAYLAEDYLRYHDSKE